METIKEVWSGILDYLHSQEDISEVAYNVWISCIEPRTIEDGEVVVYVHTNFQKKIISEHYAEKLTQAFEQVMGIPLGLKILSGEEASADPPALTPESSEPGSPFGPKGSDYEYSFENFIVGSSNKFAYAASQAVASKPAGYYNPLFIYGGSGLGKTHLLYAICNEISFRHPQMNILYIKGDEFTNEMIEAIRHGTTQEFRQRYRKADILLVDDIQFIAGKESTQEEFFHTFNSLYESKRQIVLTSDRPAKDIATLEERLLTRFEWGLTADIQPPDFETRLAIIRRKAELLDITIPENVCEYIANRLKNNIRQLEGAVKKMKAYHLLNGQAPSIATAQAAISDIINNDQPTPFTVEKIIEEVARTFGITSDEIRSAKRSANISKARQMAMYVVREITQLPTEAIGSEFGGRDHSTVVYALQQMEKNIQKDSKIKATAEDIIKNIRDR